VTDRPTQMANVKMVKHGTDDDGHVPKKPLLFKYALSAASATVAETVTYPLDLTKTRLQIQGEVLTSSGHSSPYRGMFRTAYGIATEEGFLKLWQGVTPAIYRHIVYTGCRMTFYEFIRENLLGKNEDGSFPLWKAIIGGMSAGACAQFLASPTDLVKVQMQSEGVRLLEGKKPRYRSTFHAFSRILGNGGLRALWIGWIPNVQRAALVNLGDLTTYDTVKQYILRNTNMQDNSYTHACSSGVSGFVGAVISTPADVVKTRIMKDVRMSDGQFKNYTGSWDCLTRAVHNEGFFSLYKGFFPIWARMAPWSLTFWLTYEQIRTATGCRSF